MSRYINVELLKNKILEDMAKAEREGRDCNGYTDALFHLKTMPTADVVEVKHGEWIEKDDSWGGVLYTCSVCDCDWTTIDGTPFENNMRYCPECGAKMDGERRAEE